MGVRAVLFQVVCFPVVVTGGFGVEFVRLVVRSLRSRPRDRHTSETRRQTACLHFPGGQDAGEGIGDLVYDARAVLND